MENGDKVRSAGFVKMEVAGENCNVQVSVNGLYQTDTLRREVWISGGGKEAVLGEIELDAGKGSLALKKMPASGLSEERIPYEDLEDVRIRLAKNRELICRWGEAGSGAKPRVKPAETMRTEDTGVETAQTAAAKTAAIQTDAVRIEPVPETDSIPGENEDGTQGLLYVKWMQKLDSPQAEERIAQAEKVESNENIIYMAPQEMDGQDSIPEKQDIDSDSVGSSGEDAVSLQGNQAGLPGSEERAAEYAEPETGGRAAEYAEPENGSSTAEESGFTEPKQPETPVAQKNPSVPPHLFEDKWKQLSCIYPHISPFHDGRDYLSIGPGDFVILPRKYHKLVTNSFLLHGYYNYEHLILTREMKKGEERYYLGVPGNFYDREKQVALMFGFESFECKTEPAQTGDYGYFMMRVDI